MSIKITAAEFEILPDAVKAKFEAVGDAYVLHEEDVEGLKKSKAEILAEKKRIADENEELRKFKTAKDAEAALAEEEKAKKAGDWEQVVAQKEAAWNTRFETLKAERESAFEAERSEKESLLTFVKRERLENELIKRKVLPDRAAYLVADFDAVTELVRDEHGKYTVRKKGGIGDVAEFDAIINDAKQAKPFFFADQSASGSGASGSGSSSNGSAPRKATKDQVAAMSKDEKREFYLSGGDVTDFQ